MRSFTSEEWRHIQRHVFRPTRYRGVFHFGGSAPAEERFIAFYGPPEKRFVAGLFGDDTTAARAYDAALMTRYGNAAVTNATLGNFTNTADAPTT